MSKIMKRLALMLLACVLLCSFVSVTAFAEETTAVTTSETGEPVGLPEGELPEGEMPEGEIPKGEMPEGGMPDFEGGMPDFGDGEMPAMFDNSDVVWEEEIDDVPDTASVVYKLAIAAVVLIGIGAVVLTVLAIVKLVKKTPPAKQGMKKGPYTAILAVVMVVIIVGMSIANQLVFSTYVNSVNALFTQTTKSNAGIATNASNWKQLCYDIASEGMVLLKNENNTLPIDTSGGSVKVNLLGYRGYDPIYTGSGSGATSSEGATDFLTTLENAGFEVNPACVNENVYERKEGKNTGLGFMSVSFSIDEAPIEKYKGTASFESMKAYSDIAIVVIGRTGGEGGDLTAFEGENGKTYLQLCKEEEDLLRTARETFGTLIVLYNGVNTLEMGFLDTYDVDAALWVGIPGANGLTALGPILNGTVNPSGHTVDTWAYDLNSAPASENYGEQAAANADNEYYVDYAEGIYVGYKWYETAYAEGAVVTNTKTGVTYDYSDYDSIVQFPFGYGLSYTTFTQEIVGGTASGASVDPTDDITVQVKVTNTGSVAGKEVVQLYLTAPYTDYDKANGVEKSAVSLIAYDKTDLLQPGQSQTLELTFSAEDMASYDMSHDNGDGTTGCYMLDAGDYILSIRANSHEVYGETSVKVSSQHFYCGENKRSSDDQAAYNQLDYAARGLYLSRQDGFANYEEVMKSVSPNVESLDFSNNYNAYDPAFDEAVTKEYVKGVDYEAPGSLTLADMKGLSYDDPQWEELIKQLSMDDIVSLMTENAYSTPAVDSIGKAKTSESDGPLGLSSMFSTATNTSYPCIPLLTASFNDDLARTYGNFIADEAHSIGVSGWYAPAMNTHRWAYSGRNFEYYSEDGVLAGGIASNTTYGAREKGLIVYLKHFVLNDQETKRSGKLHTYANEQSIREIYLKPFEDCVKDGNATAIMSSMNYVGDEYIGVSEQLQIEILRNEWGFRGRIVTDATENAYMTACSDAAIRSGTNMWLAMGTMEFSTDSNADIYYLQRTAHDILYTQANAQVFEASVLNWKPLVYILDAELVLICIACALFIVNKHKKRG